MAYKQSVYIPNIDILSNFGEGRVESGRRIRQVTHQDDIAHKSELLLRFSEAGLIHELEGPTAKPIQSSPIGADEFAYAEPVVVPFPNWIRGTLAISLAVVSWAGVIGLLKLI